MRPLALAALSATLAGACIVEAPGGASPQERRQAVVTQLPPMSVKSGARLDERLEVLGGSIQPSRLRPGEPVRVTLFLKVLEPLEEDYDVFVHVEGAEGRLERLNADHPPAGGLYPSSQWKQGETIKDEFSFALPPDSAARAVNIWYGFWHRPTDGRLRVSNPEAVRTDGNDRLLLAQLPVAP